LEASEEIKMNIEEEQKIVVPTLENKTTSPKDQDIILIAATLQSQRFILKEISKALVIKLSTLHKKLSKMKVGLPFDSKIGGPLILKNEHLEEIKNF